MAASDTWLEEVKALDSLDAVFKHAMKQEPRWLPEDVVIQDEYTHDVIFRVRDDRFLVLDAT